MHTRTLELLDARGLADQRLYELLRSGKFILVNAFTDNEHVISITAQDRPGVCLVRPDGYVAWTGADPQAALREWC